MEKITDYFNCSNNFSPSLWRRITVYFKINLKDKSGEETDVKLAFLTPYQTMDKTSSIFFVILCSSINFHQIQKL